MIVAGGRLPGSEYGYGGAGKSSRSIFDFSPGGGGLAAGKCANSIGSSLFMCGDFGRGVSLRILSTNTFIADLPQPLFIVELRLLARALAAATNTHKNNALYICTTVRRDGTVRTVNFARKLTRWPMKMWRRRRLIVRIDRPFQIS